MAPDATVTADASTSTTTGVLTAEQLSALFDILTHHETYAEIESFKSPDAVTSYGFPFRKAMTALPFGQGSAGGSRSSTPAATPRVRTPVSFWQLGKSKEEVDDSDKQDDKQDDIEEQDKVQTQDNDDDDVESASPLLQMLLTRLVLPFPGVDDLSREFWAVRMQGLLARFGEADLSESYEKGAMGTRKTLATGASSVIEMVARGLLGGVDDARKATTATTITDSEKQKEASDANTIDAKEKPLMGEYDHGKAKDLLKAWEDVVQEWAYGDLVDQMFDYMVDTDDVEGHSHGMKAAVDYGIIHLATFAHHIFILSPEGQYLLKLIENINGLIPYKMIKQTLRIGNAATMISGMVRLMLTKLSVTSVTNWIGLTANADDGTNLLQRIISIVLSWDASEFKKGAERVEKERSKEDAPTEEMLQVIQQHVQQSRGEHVVVRNASEEHGQSIVVAILNASNPDLASTLTEAQHLRCLEYYSALLSVHDRDAITSVLCRQPPDLFTATVRDIVAAYEPMIRKIHSGVDLRDYLELTQGFISDLIHASKPKKVKKGDSSRKEEKDDEIVAGVEDYVLLLRKNKGLLFSWVHALASKCPDVWEDFRVWARDVAVRFRQEQHTSREESIEAKDGITNRKTMKECLDELFLSLDESARAPVLKAIDAHASYLSRITRISQARLQHIITTTSSSTAPSPTDSEASTAAAAHDSASHGPGIYLSRWQSLLDNTPITPSSPHGPLRHGREVKHISTMGKLGLGGQRVVSGDTETTGIEEGPAAPDVKVVVTALGEGFRGLVRERMSSGKIL